MAYRTERIADLAQGETQRTVRLAGWAASVRDHGGMVFINLRDVTGLVQIVARPEDPEVFDTARTLKPESVVAVDGTVLERPEGLRNPDMATGHLEVQASAIEVLSSSETLPFVIAESADVSPALRMQYRYLDLRQPDVRKGLLFRHRLTRAVREYLSDRHFIEVETPILTRSTPEGARDYLVPSRIHDGSCYALPQSPQLFKQLLMVAGLDRYFQVARCFRDEDQRADRQPEFTQVDIEMSFVHADDVMALAEDMTVELFKDLVGHEVPTPLTRLTYADAMARYGSDKPDLRFGLEIQDVTEIASQCEFKVFSSQGGGRGVIRGLCAPGAASYSRKKIDGLEKTGKLMGLKGLVNLKIKDGTVQSSVAKFFRPEQLTTLAEAMGAKDGDLLLLAAGNAEDIAEGLGAVRSRLGRELGLCDPFHYALCWVVDHPLFAVNKEEQRLDPVHHPFTMPLQEDEPLLETDPARVRAYAYDLVLNGHEVAGGSIRIHRGDLQKKVFSLIQLSEEAAQDKFGFLLEAFRYGAPPHGGIAFGFDRFVALMQGLENIRDVIAFPKTTRAFCPLTGAPGTVSSDQLTELGLRREARKEDGEDA